MGVSVMPISPTSMSQAIDTDIVDAICRNIDSELGNPSRAYTHKFGDGSFRLVLKIARDLTEGERTRLITLYKNAGWSEVSLLHSSENGERPGLLKVQLKSVGG
jgi:hypothetical protein